MKLKLAVFIFLVSCTGINAQTQRPNEPDSLPAIIKKLLQDVIEDSYTRIPKKEFESNIQAQVIEKVDAKVDREFGRIINVGLGVIGLLTLVSGAIFFSAKSMMQNMVKEQAETKFKELQEQIEKENKRDIDHIFLSLYKDKFEEKMEEYRKIVDTQLKEVMEDVDEMKKGMAAPREESVFTKLEKLKQEIDTKTYSDQTFYSLKELLEDAEAKKDFGMMSTIIGELSLASYYMKKEFEMDQIVTKYSQIPGINIKETVFLNLASGYFYYYNDTGNTADREKCLEYISKSLKKLGDYGEALGLKLELAMLDYEKSKNNEEKGKFLGEAKEVIEKIKQSKISAFETINRFERVKVNPVENSFISLLDEFFPDDMKAIKELADTYKILKK